MKQEFLYEFNCIEDGEWIPKKKTFEDQLVMGLRRCWKHRYNLERRYSQQYLRDNAARWRFRKQQEKIRRRLISGTVRILPVIEKLKLLLRKRSS